MTHANKLLGKIALLTFMLVGVSAGSAFASAGTPKQKTKTTPAASTMKKTAAAPKKAKTAKKKDITLEEARTKALRRVKGTVESGELKTEHGKGVYEFQIRDSKGKVKNVWVEQANGKIIRGGRKWY